MTNIPPHLSTAIGTRANVTITLSDFPHQFPSLNWVELPYEPYPQTPIKGKVSAVGYGFPPNHAIRAIDNGTTYYGQSDENGRVTFGTINRP